MLARQLQDLAPSPGLAGAWCNANRVMSSAMEALSFATPALERFFIRTVTATLSNVTSPQVLRQALDFVHEEARHSVAHRRFNVALTAYLGGPPPGLATLETLLTMSGKHLPITVCLQLVEVLERVAEGLSKAYLQHEHVWRIECCYARCLFAQHAREEVGHHSVIRALRNAPSVTRPMPAVAGGLAWLAVLLVGTTYLGLSVPWIWQRKRLLTGRQA